MKEPKFALGDVVTLKSGGPPMTVQKMDVDDVDFEEYVLCKWFDADNKPCTESFAPAALVKAPM
jgi:uncharacterized protein YodC (DUF2158 family)